MAKPTTTQSVMDKLRIDDTPDNNQVFTLAGQKPDEIALHTLDKEFIILGITPDAFVKTHGSEQFDFDKLCIDFSKICEDFADNLMSGKESKAVEFCSRIIYLVGPESRRVKKATGDKTWVFKFPYVKNGKPVVRTAFVCTFKGEGIEYKPTDKEDKIILTIKQAGLLAMVVFSKLIAFAGGMAEPCFLLTPLAGAVYSRDNIREMAAKLKTTAIEVCKVINASCQSGGQYLVDSEVHTAVCATISATRSMKNEKAREAIISKVTKQYLVAGKVWDKVAFMTYAEYATGGVPKELEPANLLATFEEAQFRPMDIARAMKGTDPFTVQGIDILGLSTQLADLVKQQKEAEEALKRSQEQAQGLPPPPAASGQK